MDIVLNTRFNNPRLPQVELPGFYDDFGPAGGPPSDTSLGETSREFKPWTYMNTNGWARTEHHTATRATTDTSLVAVVDGHAADGVLTTTLAVPPASGIYGLVFRYQSASNYLRFEYNTNQGYFYVREIADGVSWISNIYTPPQPPAAGDTLSVEMLGERIRTFFNDELAHDLNLSSNLGNTQHGFRSDTTEVEFNDIEFIPA